MSEVYQCSCVGFIDCSNCIAGRTGKPKPKPDTKEYITVTDAMDGSTRRIEVIRNG